MHPKAPQLTALALESVDGAETLVGIGWRGWPRTLGFGCALLALNRHELGRFSLDEDLLTIFSLRALLAVQFSCKKIVFF